MGQLLLQQDVWVVSPILEMELQALINQDSQHCFLALFVLLVSLPALERKTLGLDGVASPKAWRQEGSP